MNKIKPLTLEETKLKEEMKARCLNGGQYKDVNAKKKFNVLCHLEDFEIQYWKLAQENQKLKEQVKDEENWRIKIAKENERLHKDCLAIIQQRDLYKSVIDEINLIVKGVAYGGNEEYYIEKFKEILTKAKVGDISE